MTVSRKILCSTAALMTGMLFISQPAVAGFQFSPPPAQQAAPQAAPQDNYSNNNTMAPMPIVPALPVEAEQLPPVGSYAPAAPVTRPSANQRLVINPYPLQQQDSVATHGQPTGQLGLDQAIMEQSGQLKTVATPGGNNASGMIARSTVISRYDRNATTPAPRPVSRQMDYDAGGTSMTPIPGGEGDNLYPVEKLPPVATIQQIPRAPQDSMPRPAIPAVYPSVAAPASSAPSGGFAEAVGFGREVPLALALSQVVPADYSYSFAPSVNAGETASWKGGKSWDAVLQDMLTPLGLRAVIKDKQVMIQNAG